MLNPIGSKVIYTNRFILRPFLIGDYEMMYYFYLSDKEVCKYLEFEPYFGIKEAFDAVNIYVNNYKNPFYFHWAIVEKKTGYVIGSTSIHNLNFNELSGELGICLSRLYWNKGVGKEVLSKVRDYALYQVNVENLYAFHVENNIASRKIIISLGLKDYPKKDSILVKRNYTYKVKCLKLSKNP